MIKIIELSISNELNLIFNVFLYILASIHFSNCISFLTNNYSIDFPPILHYLKNNLKLHP